MEEAASMCVLRRMEELDGFGGRVGCLGSRSSYVSIKDSR